MIPLPPDVRFDPWRGGGVETLLARQEALDTASMPAGDHPFSTQLLLGGGVTRGVVDAQGKRLTDLRFTTSLYAIFGNGTAGPSDSPGYSWPSGSGHGALVKCPAGVRHILANLNIVLPDRVTPRHHYEWGFHGVWSAKDSQLILLNVGIYNAENALILGGNHSHAKGVTIGIRGNRLKNAEGMQAHYAVIMQGNDNVVEDLTIEIPAYHSIGVQGGSRNIFWGVNR